MADLEKKVETSTKYAYRKVTEHLANTSPPKIVMYGGGAEQLEAWCRKMDDRMVPYAKRFKYNTYKIFNYLRKKSRVIGKKVF